LGKTRLLMGITWCGDSSPIRGGARVPSGDSLRATLAELRAAYARYPGDRYFEELIEELKEISTEFRRWWPHHHDVRSTLDGHKSIPHPTLGRLEFEHINMQVLTAFCSSGNPECLLPGVGGTGNARAELLYAHAARSALG
jgi:hypothetical protein